MKVMLWKYGINDGTEGELPHIGLGILARDIKDAGHDVFIIDNHFDSVDANIAIGLLEQERPDILGVSMVSQEWVLPQPQAMLNTAYKMGVPIWIGGPHTTGYWDRLENDRRLSKIIVGEADGVFEDILNNKDRVIHLGQAGFLHSPDFTCMSNFQNMINYPIYTSRGCRYRCSFCAGSKTHANWRPRFLDDSFWEEIDNIKKYPRVTQVCVIDDNFTANLDYAKFFLKEYIKRGYPYKLNIFNVRADEIDNEFLKLLKLIGMKELSVGIESADLKVARLMKKGESLETIRRAINLIQCAGITPWLHMIIGLPGDSPEAHRRSLDWVTSKIPMPRIVQWNHYAPYRGTRAYDFFVKQGDILDGFISGLSGVPYDQLPQYGLFDSKGFTRKQKMLAQLEGYLRCYSPILILNDEQVKKICKEHGIEQLYNDWRKNAPIEDFIANKLPKKISKGQLSELNM